MNEVISMSEKLNNGAMQSPLQMLQDAIKELESHENLKAAKKCIVLFLNEEDGSYDVRWMQAGMKMSQCVTLCDMAKSRFKEEMGY
jgi:hypothetical protein